MLDIKRTVELPFKGSLTDFLTIARQFALRRGYVAYDELLWNLSVEPHARLADVRDEFIQFCFDPIVRIPTEQKTIEIDLDTVLERRPKQGNEDLILRIIKIWMDKHGNCRWVYAKVFGYQLNNITCIDVYSKIKHKEEEDDSEEDDGEEDNPEIEHWPIIEPIWMELVDELRGFGLVDSEREKEVVELAQSVEPEMWTIELKKMGLAIHSAEWWRMIEKLTRSFWERKGKNALPISGKGLVTLEKIVGYTRKTIYEKTSLGDKERTEGDTR